MSSRTPAHAYSTSNLHPWGYTGNKQIARVNTGQKNERSVCHNGRRLTNVQAKKASFSENTWSCKTETQRISNMVLINDLDK